MELREININAFESNVKCEYYIDENDSILKIDVSGTYRQGSSGNIDAYKIYTGIVAYFFWIEPQCILVDLSKLEYTWGNTMLKVLNLMTHVGRNNYEKNTPIAFVVSPKNEKAISSLLQIPNNKLPNYYFYESSQALEYLVQKLNS
ncbi:MAG: hypothetical protein IT236_08860 [Bacteroidia bacterium]|nr:hypothetical protein [Bacteroidia bacterium]